MKENMIDVLVYIFDNYLSVEEEVPVNEGSLTDELEEAGFQADEINQAFDWLGALITHEHVSPFIVRAQMKDSLRVFSQEEQYKLDVHCQGFLINLEQAGHIDAHTREVIIDRVMAFESSMITLQQFKRIVGIVMLNKVQQKEHHEELLVTLEDLIGKAEDNSRIFH